MMLLYNHKDKIILNTTSIVYAQYIQDNFDFIILCNLMGKNSTLNTSTICSALIVIKSATSYLSEKGIKPSDIRKDCYSAVFIDSPNIDDDVVDEIKDKFNIDFIHIKYREFVNNNGINGKQPLLYLVLKRSEYLKLKKYIQALDKVSIFTSMIFEDSIYDKNTAIEHVQSFYCCVK